MFGPSVRRLAPQRKALARRLLVCLGREVDSFENCWRPGRRYPEERKGGILVKPGTAPGSFSNSQERNEPDADGHSPAVYTLYGFLRNSLRLYFPITSTTNVSASTSRCVEPWPCLAVTVITLCVFESRVAVRAPDCVSISSSTLNL